MLITLMLIAIAGLFITLFGYPIGVLFIVPYMMQLEFKITELEDRLWYLEEKEKHNK